VAAASAASASVLRRFMDLSPVMDLQKLSPRICRTRANR